MPALSVRRLDEETVHRLRMLAAKHGVSMEEEARQILKRAVSAPDQLGDLAIKLFGSAYGGGELKLPQRENHDPLTLK